MVESGCGRRNQGPVVINGRAEIGNNCTLGHIVTIGQVNRGEKKGSPKIGLIGDHLCATETSRIIERILVVPQEVLGYSQGPKYPSAPVDDQVASSWRFE
jgi:hypothetical protein